jgi:diaminohydroxyphosphoribosylaminopyrimidine deaminase/5-amino-6-(5-phosphoribosylamino)uracil reductase
VLASFIKAGLVDRIVWIRNPMLIGGDGLPAISDLGLTELDDGRGYTLDQRQVLGDDILEVWQRR